MSEVLTARLYVPPKTVTLLVRTLLPTTAKIWYPSGTNPAVVKT